MKANEAKLLDFLKKSPQFVIPIYQRTYSWTDKECRQLWEDIIRTGADDRVSVHFVGSIVYIDKADSNVTAWEPLLVIDGQQRLTTVTLLVAALANAIGETEPLDGFSAEMLRGYYLLNPLERGDRKFKLVLSQTDKTSLIAIVGNQEQPSEYSVRVSQNFKLFEDLLAARGDDLTPVCKGLAKLMMVDIKLKRGEDNPQLIFESMNSTGKRLSQADLIRNYILMGLEPDLQTRLYEEFWRPMEVDFGQEAYGTHFDAFMRHYLTVKTGEIPRLDEVYDAFKDHASSADAAAAGVGALVKDIREFARHFCAMALGAETDGDLKLTFHDLRELKVDVAYPFLLELYHDYKADQLTKDELQLVVRLVEAYVFRRAICAIPTNSMNKTFGTFTKAVKKDRYLESIQAQFLLLPSYRRFPTDEEFHRDLQTRDLYNFRSRSYWLRRLENHGRKERVAVDEYTIEHILPQSDNSPEKVPDYWREALGTDWRRVWDTYKHTLGNLTLTAYNSDFSNRPFLEKRDMPDAAEKGLRQSPLKLNQGLGLLETWDEDAIKIRAGRLAELAVAVWSGPDLAPDVLEGYRPKTDEATAYTIDDHLNLLTPSLRPVFDGFRKAVLALDPCVSEEFLKLYVAYKAETNFVDVVPQAKRMRISFNMRFADVNDPKGLCRDITGIGRWGNGDVEIGLSKLEELPYVLGIVRQSLEQQLGNGGDA
jgi:uncharacterized protein with ParB-like and HNH nuclease domain/predicted transport protein